MVKTKTELQPLVSIIIPVYNRVSLLEETLQTVLNQSYSNWECLLVDDGSLEDNQRKIASLATQDPRIHFFHRVKEKIKGPSSCRNTGLKNAKGEYVMFLDSDDLLKTKCIEGRVSFAIQHPNFDFWVFSSKTFITKPEDENSVFNKPLTVLDSKDYLKLFEEGKHPFCILGPLWKKEVIIALKGFDEQLTTFEDPDLHIRALQKFEVKSGNLSEYDSYYRIEFKKPINRVLSKEASKKLDRAAFVFFSKHLNNPQLDMTSYAVSFFKRHTLPLSGSKIGFNLYQLLVQKDLLPKGKQFYALLLWSYKCIGFTKFPPGYYTLKQKLLPK